MEEQVAPLYYYPPTADLRAIREAYLALNLGLKVQPYSATEHSSTRILAVGEKPDWLTDYAYIQDATDPNFEKAILWALHLIDLDHGPTTALIQLKRIMGDGVKQVEAA